MRYNRAIVTRPNAKTDPLAAPGALPTPRKLLTAHVTLHPDTERERDSRMEALKSELGQMLREGRGESVIDHVLSLVVDLERENERMAWVILRAARYRFGRQTEKLSREELEQLLLAFGGDEASVANEELVVPAPEAPAETVDAQAETDGIAENQTGRKPRKKKSGGAIRVASTVERREVDVPVADEDRTCAICGRDKKTCKNVVREQIVYEPAKIYVLAENLEMVACTTCRADVVVAERVAKPTITRRVGPSLIAKLVKDKCANGLPLHRQRKELARLGLELTDKTVDSYWAYAMDLLEPIGIATVSDVLGSPIVGADDTHLKVLDKSAKGGVSRGRFWCFVGTDGIVGGPETVAYTFAKSWSATEIRPWFSAIDGFVQCDAYAGYARELPGEDGEDAFVAVEDDQRLGCGMHIRSKFHAALLAKDKRAAIPIKLFADLYAIEADCKAHGLDADARGEVRRERSIPIIDALFEWIDVIHPKLLPKSPLREATTYARGQEVFFRRCFADGRFEIDNGRVERRIRPFAVGRRNFLFTGSVRGGERLATAFTLVDNCLILGVDPQRYLEDVIVKLEAGWPMARLSELIPRRWTLEHAAEEREQRS